MLHFFWTGYAIRENSFTQYEAFNFELPKWAEYYLGQKTPFHQSNWSAGRVTENADDILLGHPTWDNSHTTNKSARIKRDWVKDNALVPTAPCHPHTYILMPWVPEFPEEWMPNLVHLESQLMAARKIFALCGDIWIERTLAKVDGSIQSLVKDKLVQLNIGIAAQNLPIVKQKFNPIGKRQILHISTLGSYKGFDITCESLKGLDTLLNVASKSLQASPGLLDVTIQGKKYHFNFLGSINNADPQFNQWAVDTCDFYIHTGTMDAQATAILENSARGLIPLVTPESGFACPDAIYLTFDADENRKIIAQALQLPESELLERSRLVRTYILKEHSWEKTFDKVWREINADIEQHSSFNTLAQANLPVDLQGGRETPFSNEVITRGEKSSRDYISPELEVIYPDLYFPNMIVGDTNNCPWMYLRREVPHNWYVDRRQPGAGFLNRDEAHILYNNALQFKGKRGLEIGCWMGWSACHLALAGVELDVIDPLLDNPAVYGSVSSSLKAASVLDTVNLVAGYSPQKVEDLVTQFQRRWSFIFIDGNHDAPAPEHDAIICEQIAEADAMIIFHDLASPDVAQGLDYLKEKGWNTMVYQTMQIMGVAWRGNVEPIKHIPDPKVDWQLPSHLQHYAVSSSSQEIDFGEFRELLVKVRPFTVLSDSRLFSLYALAKYVCINDLDGNFVECGTYRGGAAALMASVIKRYSQRPRTLYAFDTFEGMPEPTEVDRHDGIPANDTGLGFGTLKAPIRENLDRVCQLLDVTDIVVPVPGLFAQTLPQYKSQIESIAFLHADGDWYESTMDIFNHLYDLVVPYGMIQIDDYGHWEGCRKAIRDFERLHGEKFNLNQIDYTGVWLQKHQMNILQNLALNEINLVVFPDWSQTQEIIYTELQRVIKALLTHSQSDRIMLLIYADKANVEQADEILAEAVMNLLMQENLEFQQEPQISIVSELHPLQWQALLPKIRARVELEYEDKAAISSATDENIPSCSVEQIAALEL